MRSVLVAIRTCLGLAAVTKTQVLHTKYVFPHDAQMKTAVAVGALRAVVFATISPCGFLAIQTLANVFDAELVL
jgi:hypothetical protein